MSGLQLRELTAEQRVKAFVSDKGKERRAMFVDTVREMEGGIAYAISTNGLTKRMIHVNMNRAAKSLGLRLRWAPGPQDAAEVVVELSDSDPDPKAQPSRNPTLRRPR